MAPPRYRRCKGAVMWRVVVPSEVDQVTSIRRELQEYLTDCGVRDELDVVTLMVSELFTNAVLHGDAPRDARVEVSPEVVRVEVHDGSVLQPRVMPVDVHRIGGNGMRIVQGLSTAWGVRPAPPPGKTVWFEVARSRV